MHGKSIVVDIDGNLTIKEHIRPPTLDWLQKTVDGPIEQVPYFGSYKYQGALMRCVAYCNEEGKLHGLPVNEAATVLWQNSTRGELRDILVGNVVILFGDDAFMREL